MITTGTSAVQLLGHSTIVGVGIGGHKPAKITNAVTEYTARKPRSPSWSRSDPRNRVLDNST
jgi:hypothetical protein